MGLYIIDANIARSMRRFGQTIKYYPGRLCACVGENNGVPLPNHTCNQGWYYDTVQIIEGIRTAINYKILASPQGRIYNGGATFTIPKFDLGGNLQSAHSTIAHGDVLVLDNKTRRDTDVLQRGIRDFIYAFDVTQILSVYDSNNNKYVEGTDFVWDNYPAKFGEAKFGQAVMGTDLIRPNLDLNSVVGGLSTITWLDGKGPADQTYYTVEFICKQQYRVWDDGGQDRGTDDDELPKKVLCVLRRYVNPTENPADNVDVNQAIY